MKIGQLELNSKLLMAPMADITYSPFRKLARENGAGLTFTQMVSAKGVLSNNIDTLRYLIFNKKEKPIGIQILGNDPAIIKEAVKELQQYKPDVIDLNCGCSVSKVCDSNMGGKILDDPHLLGKIVKNMVDASNGVPISVKLRLGSGKKKINILENCRIAEENGASLVIVHARTREDSYSVSPDWSWLKIVKENLKIPVIGNGSVFTPQDAVRMINETGVDGVMIARGALGNPFIFSRFNSIMNNNFDPGIPSFETLLETVDKHISYSIEEFGEFTGILKSKKHIIWYFRFYGGIDNLINEISPLKELNQIQSVLHNHVERIREGKYLLDDISQTENKFNDRVIFWTNTDNN